MTIGERIRAARKKAGLTQRELAEKSEISLMSIRRYETGERTPSAKVQRRIEAAAAAELDEDAAQSRYYMVSALIFHYTSKYRESKEIITEICEMVGKLLKAEEPCGGGGVGMIRGWLEEILANEEETPDG